MNAHGDLLAALTSIRDHPPPKDFYKPDTLRNIIGDLQEIARAAIEKATTP